MSQDLLSEFDSLYSAPVPARAASSIHSFPATTTTATSNNNRRSTFADPLNLNLPPAPPPPQQRQKQLPLHNVPLIRTASRSHQHRASATNFDDLLGYVNSPQAPWPPKPPQVTRLGQTQRPVSFHGALPNSSKIDLFEALGDDFSGGDGRGGRFTPPPQGPTGRNAFNGINKFTPPKQRPVSVASYGGFSTPTPPPDLLDMLGGGDKEEEEDDDDFGDFASASPNQSSTPKSVITGFGAPSHSAANTTPPRGAFSGLYQNGGIQRTGMGIGAPPLPVAGFGASSFHSAARATPPRDGFSGLQHNGSTLRTGTDTPPPPPTPPKTNNRGKQISPVAIIDDDEDFGEFMTSPTTAAPPSRTFNTPAPRTFNTPPPRTFNTPPPPSTFNNIPPPGGPPNLNRHSITLRNFAPMNPPPAKKKPSDDLVPPVSVLLAAFPPLFLLPQTHLLDKLTSLPFPLRQRVLAQPKTREFLEGICELGRVAGRIIAGRKRRGTRNRSGSRGGGGGMKLGATGTNSGWEAQKEEREVKETCRLWGDGAGRLKAAMGAGVPELVDTARNGPVSKVVMECRLCGLGKGEVLSELKERIDRLGWWDAGWGGHGGCRGFWENHGRELRR